MITKIHRTSEHITYNVREERNEATEKYLETTGYNAVVKFNNYISDAKIFDKFFLEGTSLYIDSKTGSGKTISTIKFLHERFLATGKTFTFVAPYKSVALDVYNSCKRDGMQVKLYYAGLEKPTADENVITIYNHADKFTSTNTLIIDEIHRGITDLSYRASVLRDNLYPAIYRIQTKIFLTGTPVKCEDMMFDNCFYVKAVKASQVERKVNVIETNDKSFRQIVVTLAKYNKNRGLTSFIALPSTSEELEKLIHSLHLYAGFSKDKIVCFNSKTINNKEYEVVGCNDQVSKNYLEIYQKTQTFGDAEVIIGTYLDGYSIKGLGYSGKGFSCIVCPNERGVQATALIDVPQVVARFRDDLESPNYVITRNFKIQSGLLTEKGFIPSDKVKDKIYSRKRSIKEVQNLLKIVSTSFRDEAAAVVKPFKARKAINAILIDMKYREVKAYNKGNDSSLCIDQSLNIDETLISYHTYNKVHSISRNNKSLFLTCLKYAGLRPVLITLKAEYVDSIIKTHDEIIKSNGEVKITETKIETEVMAQTKLTGELKKAQNREIIKDFFTALEESNNPSELKGDHIELYKLWKALKGFTHYGVSLKTLEEFASEDLLNKAVYNRYLKELTYRFTTEDKRLISFRNSLYSTVKVNDTFTNHKIQVLIRKAAETSGLSDLKGFNTSDRECVKLFKMFFEIETEIVRVSSSKLNRNYVVVTIK